MKVSIPDEDILELVENLGFVIALCADQHKLLDEALFRFCNTTAFPAAQLAADLQAAADRLAQAIGFPDASLDPTR